MQVAEYEKNIKELEERIKKIEESTKKTSPGVKERTLRILKHQLDTIRQNMYQGVSRWQKVQIARHPARPYTLDYIEHITTGFIDIHGDRLIGDDNAIIGGFATFEGRTCMFIGHQKGRTLLEKQFRNFGMPNPEGFRKALRLMKLAEKFNKPIITFIDTPGASTGLEAEERGQAEAIGTNLREMVKLNVPIIAII